ncbi:MAG TPA: aminopeptidase [Candidatus Binataceae bacterium]|nr:aminopeptidase [Candidatus Binataceae bacterium]
MKLSIDRRIGSGKTRLRVLPVVHFATAAIASVAIAGCSIGYVARGAYEEARLLWNRRPISAELANSDLSPEVRAKLETVLRVREFAAQKLGLNVGGAYLTVSQVDQQAIVHVVMAAPRDSLDPYTWWFPIVGAVPYRGYFAEADAQAEADKMEAAGYDTMVRSAVAFSSLGFFDDPLLSNLLKLDRVELAGVLIHEMFHRTYFLPGEVMFDESAANWVGARGAIEFFTSTEGASSPDAVEARSILDSNLKFADFLLTEQARLLKIYLSGEPKDEILKQREVAFVQIKADYARLAPELNGLERFDLDTEPLNNAVLVNYLIYFHDLDNFEALFRMNHGDLKQTIQRIIDLAKSNPNDPFYPIWEATRDAPEPGAALPGDQRSPSAPAITAESCGSSPPKK